MFMPETRSRNICLLFYYSMCDKRTVVLMLLKTRDRQCARTDPGSFSILIQIIKKRV